MAPQRDNRTQLDRIEAEVVAIGRVVRGPDDMPHRGLVFRLERLEDSDRARRRGRALLVSFVLGNATLIITILAYLLKHAS